MKRVVLAVIWMLCAAAAYASPKKKLNVVFFLVDDLGQRDVGCYGSKFYETPAIDQLAREGVLFENAYSTCHVCSPSRASILTGKYPARTDLTEWLGGRPERDFEKLHSAQKLMALPDGEITLAETLKKHGYATANYGKAHLSKDPKTYGFDEAITGWVRSYFPPFSPKYAKTLPSKKGDYYTDRLTDAAIDFIERNRNEPFFVHLEHFAVHDPIQGRKDLVEKYRKKLASLPKQDGPDFILEGNPDEPALSAEELKALKRDPSRKHAQDKRVWWVKQKQDNVEFAGMVEAMDESLGRIRTKLKELGLENNTIVIFTADNGGMSASNQYLESNKSRDALDRRFASSNLPLRGAKGWNYEGGIRVPLIVHWPGVTKPNTKSQSIVTGTDHYPTLLQMLELPAMPKQHLDGKSFVPALKGGPHERGAIYWHFPHYSNHGYQSPGGAIRDGRYKLLEYYENGGVQLFDLENDLGEQNDLAKSKPEITERLLKSLHDWRKAVDAKMPRVKTAESRRKRTQPIGSKNLPADVEKFAHGWKVRNWGGPGMKPGLRLEWNGRKNVLLTHPRSRTVPCVLSRKYRVPRGKKTRLEFAVNHHARGDWDLVVRVAGKAILKKSIQGSKWQEFRIDLSDHAGKTVALELENRASGWAFEGGYWSRLQLVSQ
ncbi:MAG: sulfatase [Planctomycetota bacterium]